MHFAFISLTTSAVLYAVFALLVAISRRRAGGVVPIVVAGIAQMVWSLAQAMLIGAGAVPLQQVFLVELARDACWLWFAASLLPPVPAWHTARFLRWAAFGIPLLAALGMVFPAIFGVSSPEGYARMFFISALVISVAGFLLVEQAYRNTPQEYRWGQKFLALGLGGIFAYDLFLYSHAELFKGLSQEFWGARGFANVLVLPLLAIGARRYRPLAVEIFVSRQAVFFSATMIGVGVYLLLMAVAGYYLRAVGGEWGEALQAVFLLGAVLVLAVVLLSGDLRARAKVFLSKHFYANKYDYREQWLGLTGRLADETGGHTVTVRAIRGLAGIVQSPGGALWVRHENSGSTASRYELAGTWHAWDCPALVEANPLLSLIEGRQWVVHTADLALSPGRYENVSAPPFLGEMAANCLLVPLIYGDDTIALVALRDPRISAPLDYEDIDILKTAGRQVAEAVKQEQASRMLAESRQFEAYNRLTAFLMHDLKNLVAQQSLVVRNAERYKHDPEFVDDAIETIANSVARMEHVIEQLRRGPDQGLVRYFGLSEAVREACDRQGQQLPRPEVETDGADQASVQLDRDRFVSVLCHVIRNAQDASDPDQGQVRVTATLLDGRGVVAVEDDGEGMDEAFVRERLFRPFDSTKGTKGMGIGAYQVRQFVEGAGGEVNVTSAPGEGTRFEISLPLADPEQQDPTPHE